MEKIRFLNNDTIYDVQLSFLRENIVKIQFTSIPSEKFYLSGFKLLNEHNLSVMGDFSLFTTKYKDTDEENTIYLSTGEVYVEPVVPDPEPIPEPTEEELVAQKLAEFNIEKENKIYEMRSACETTIEKVLQHQTENLFIYSSRPV